MKSCSNYTKTLVLLLVAVMVAGCAPNNFTIRLAYSRLDNNIYKRLNQYATFDQQQRAWIESSALDYQVWHRQSELPGYARLFDEVANMIESGETMNVDDVDQVMQSLETFSQAGFSRSPFAHSVAFLKTLDDNQVDEINAHFVEQDKQTLEHLREHEDGGENDRTERITKTFSRIGLSLQDFQKDIIRSGLERYVGNREDRVTAWQNWQATFIQILETRNQPGFDAVMQGHIDQYQRQMEIQYPQRSAKNRMTSMETIAELINSLDPEQRRDFSIALRNYSTILVAMAESSQTTLL